MDLVAADPTYDEDSSGDLGDSFAQRTQLGRGANRALGAIDPEAEADYLSFQGLEPGASLSLALDIPVGNGGVTYAWLDDTAQVLENTTVYNNSSQPGPIEGTVPSNGEVHLGITDEEGGFKTWGVTLEVPEPGRAGLLGAALSTLAGLVRLRGRKS